ncbi:MAG TPA: stage IV sporulation protein A [Clostridiales bacterium]|nr:stage IV sporulation protein A [Clostridiales bacterium]
MSEYNIYKDIAERTNGDIYIGVVGPVRTGKSTFITKVMEKLVLPNIAEGYSKERTIDEMPQSGDGKSIMTTQPKFIPSQAVGVSLDKDVNFKVRLIDCVGYLVEGALGHEENSHPRMVSTPWDENDIPFEKAAEIGTNKVITEHSTVAIMVTTDGSITDLDRDSYIKAEEKVISELKNCQKPFVIVLNSTHPKNIETINLAKSLSNKYKTKVLPLNVDNMEDNDLNEVFEGILHEFPVKKVAIKFPDWLQILDYTSDIIKNIIENVKSIIDSFDKVDELPETVSLGENSGDFEPEIAKSLDLGQGKLTLTFTPKSDLYYRVLSGECGQDIKDEFHLISYIKQLSVAKVQYDKFKDAIEQVKENGYGVVHPDPSDLTLEEPKMYKSGGKYGVKLRASAPSLHIMQVDIQTEVNSMVGNEQQSEELVKSLMEQFESDPKEMWETKVFGRSLYSLVNDDLQNKLHVMPQEVQRKMRRTLGRIVNEGKGGVICILL